MKSDNNWDGLKVGGIVGLLGTSAVGWVASQAGVYEKLGVTSSSLTDPIAFGEAVMDYGPWILGASLGLGFVYDMYQKITK